MNRRHARGVTIIEAMIAVALGLTLLTTGVLYGSKLLYDNKVARTVQDIGAFAQVVRSNWTNQINYSGVTTAAVSPLLPAQLRNGALGVTPNPFAGGYDIVAVAWNGEPTTAFDVTAIGLPASACINVLQMYGVHANQASVTVQGGASTIVKVGVDVPVTVGQATTACGGRFNDVHFVHL